jgi:nicotinamidase-related amidase
MSTEESLSLSPEETALVLIEYQNEFTTQGGGLHDAVKECMDTTGTLENSKKVMDAAREAGCTIIHVPISFHLVRKVPILMMHVLIFVMFTNLLSSFHPSFIGP